MPMKTAKYNNWYIDTYESILHMADWSRFESNVPEKIVCIFAWMPQTIMGINAGGGRKLWEEVSYHRVQEVVADLSDTFEKTKQTDFPSFEPVIPSITILYEGLSSILKPTASSKYLHFSHPRLFPMWDNRIRKYFGLVDSAQGYIGLLKKYSEAFHNPVEREETLSHCPSNFVRAYDVYLMKKIREN